MSTEEQEKTQQVETEQQQVEAQDSDDGKGNTKANRGEKKFKKQMTKLGMKPVAGINRVTIRRGKQLLLSINEPEVLKS